MTTNRGRPRVEELEPRILFSADATGLLAALPMDRDPLIESWQANAQVDVQATSGWSTETSPTDTDAARYADRLMQALASESASPGAQVVFIDGSVQDIHTLSSCFALGVEQVILDPSSDGLAQIAAYLEGRSGLAAIHLVSEGASGRIQLGDEWLDSSSLAARSSLLAQVGAAMAPGGDLLLYGCQVAQGSEGRQMLSELARLTNADVAASTDWTGAASRGGNWSLEASVGAIGTADILDFSHAEAYAHVLGTFIVTTTADAGAGSLRQAIADANANAGADTIEFSIASGLQTIAPTSALPTITGTVFLDGTTQPGHTFAPLIELSGTLAGSTANGLVLGAGSSGSTVRGLIVNGFAWDGIRVDSSGNTIEGNYVGVDATGTVNAGNGHSGIFLSTGADANTIGGNGAGQGNVLSGNGYAGLSIYDSDGNLVIGNRIGVDVTGSADLGNTKEGIYLEYADNNIIGGQAAGEGNIVSGNTTYGISINNATGNTLWGNHVGVDATGTVAIANAGNGGVALYQSNGNTIGGLSAGARNVISGNAVDGINLYLSNSNVIQGNHVGTDAAGTAALGNGSSGIYLETSADNTIGGTVDGARNLLSGNQWGIYVELSDGNAIVGNYIGLDVTGTSAIGNSQNGITLDLATNTMIGGTAAGAGNVISGNAQFGVFIGGGGSHSLLGNRIGTNASGTAAIGNDFGIVIYGSTNNAIGGAAAGAGNLVSGNLSDGIQLDSSNDNVIQGNRIGTDVSASGPLGNGAHGIYLYNGPSNNLVGGTAAGDGNVIAFNGFSGIATQASPAITGNAILGNSIHSNGILGIDLQGDWAVSPNDLGDADTGANNLQNFPVLAGAWSNSLNSVIDGSLQGNASRGYRIEFFGSAAPSGSGHGEGSTFLGFVLVSTDSAGDAVFTATLAGVAAQGLWVSATATDLTTNDTSEFALSVQVAASNDPPEGSDNTVVTPEDTAYTFSAADFGFTDPADVPANALLSVRISTLPTVGSLSNDGVALAAGDSVSRADIDLGRLRFTPGADLSGAGFASFTFQVRDDGGTSSGGGNLDTAPNTMTIDVTPVNDAPAIAPSAAAASFAENTPVVIDAGLTLADIDNPTLASATVSIGAGFQPTEDVLSFANDGSTMGNIVATYDTATGVLSLGSAGATATVSEWQAALRAVTYSNGSDAPSTANRIVGFSVDDGAAGSAVSVKTVSVAAVDDVPVVTVSIGTTAFTENTPVVIDAGLTLADIDNPTLASATVSIGAGFQPTEDVLSFANDGSTMGNIVAGYDTATGVLSLASAGATATVSEWQAALRAVTYANGSGAPVTVDRTIAFTANDGAADSAASTRTLSVVAVADAPVVVAPVAPVTAADAPQVPQAPAPEAPAESGPPPSDTPAAAPPREEAMDAVDAASPPTVAAAPSPVPREPQESSAMEPVLPVTRLETNVPVVAASRPYTRSDADAGPAGGIVMVASVDTAEPQASIFVSHADSLRRSTKLDAASGESDPEPDTALAGVSTTRLAVTAATALVGSWGLLRLAGLMTSMVAVRPLWQQLDPIPLLGDADDPAESLPVDDEAAEDESAAADLLDRMAARSPQPRTGASTSPNGKPT